MVCNLLLSRAKEVDCVELFIFISLYKIRQRSSLTSPVEKLSHYHCRQIQWTKFSSKSRHLQTSKEFVLSEHFIKIKTSYLCKFGTDICLWISYCIISKAQACTHTHPHTLTHKHTHTHANTPLHTPSHTHSYQIPGWIFCLLKN